MTSQTTKRRGIRRHSESKEQARNSYYIPPEFAAMCARAWDGVLRFYSGEVCAAVDFKDAKGDTKATIHIDALDRESRIWDPEDPRFLVNVFDDASGLTRCFGTEDPEAAIKATLAMIEDFNCRPTWAD